MKHPLVYYKHLCSWIPAFAGMTMRVFPLTLLLFLSSCSPKIYKGHYKIGKAYTKKGEVYTPATNIKYNKVGMASWYGSKNGFHGRKTANGDRYNKDMLTAAHPTLPMPSIVKVTNMKNNKSILVMINDRGPFTKKRIIDVSEKAAKILDFKMRGVAKVQVEYMPKESEDLLEKLALAPKHGTKAKKKMKDQTCSVSCFLNKMNKKRKYI